MAGAHPRVSGENSLPQLVGLPPEGSSPHERGKRICEHHGGSQGRLIPARAGKTLVACWFGYVLAAHPRSRGENGFSVIMFGRKCGSSPRERGKRLPGAQISRPRRLIPA